MKAIADYLGVHYATVSRRLRKRGPLLARKTCPPYLLTTVTGPDS